MALGGREGAVFGAAVTYAMVIRILFLPSKFEGRRGEHWIRFGYQSRQYPDAKDGEARSTHMTAYRLQVPPYPMV